MDQACTAAIQPINDSDMGLDGHSAQIMRKICPRSTPLSSSQICIKPCNRVFMVIAPSRSGDIKMSIFQNEIEATPFRLAPSIFNATRYPPLAFTRRQLTQLNCFSELSARHGWRSFLHPFVDRCCARHHRHGLLWGVYQDDGLIFGSPWLLFTPPWVEGLLAHVRYRAR